MGAMSNLIIEAQHDEDTALKRLQEAYEALCQVQAHCWELGEGEDPVYAPDVQIAEQLQEMQSYISVSIDNINKARLDWKAPALRAN